MKKIWIFLIPILCIYACNTDQKQSNAILKGKIEKEFHGKNIAFVSISVDKKSDYDKWRAMVNEKNMGGVQLLADNSFNANFIQAYKIDAIPKLILIDPNGAIVLANAPRPSDPKLKTVLNSLDI